MGFTVQVFFHLFQEFSLTSHTICADSLSQGWVLTYRFYVIGVQYTTQVEGPVFLNVLQPRRESTGCSQTPNHPRMVDDSQFLEIQKVFKVGY